MLDSPELDNSSGERSDSQFNLAPSIKGRNRWPVLTLSLAISTTLIFRFADSSVSAANDQAKIEEAVLMLGQSESTKDLVDIRNKYKIQILFADLSGYKYVPVGPYSVNRLEYDEIDLAPSLATEDTDTMADVLAHELTHTKDGKGGIYDQPNKKAACFDSEFNANQTQALFWLDRFGRVGKKSLSVLDRGINSTLFYVLNYPDLLRDMLKKSYEIQCSKVAEYLAQKPQALLFAPTFEPTSKVPVK